MRETHTQTQRASGDPLEYIFRIMDLLRTLQQGSWPPSALADRLGVSPRTIRRYIAGLNEGREPQRFIRDRDGWRLADYYKQSAVGPAPSD